MFLSTFLSISLVVMPQEFSIEKMQKTPAEVLQFDGVTINLKQEMLQDVQFDESVRLQNFPLENNLNVNILLTKFDVFTPEAEVVTATLDKEGKPLLRSIPKPSISFLRGAIEGDPSSRVFLAIGEYTTNGVIEQDGQTYVVAKGKAGGWTAVYNLSNVSPEEMNWVDFLCGVEDFPRPEIQRKNTEQLRSVGDCQALQVAVDTDWEFTNDLFEGNTAASSEYAATLMAAMSTIYSVDVGVEVHISYLRLWENAADPWSASDTATQLPQFREHWESQMSAVPRHLAHLLSGRSLGGGIAYVGTVCTSYGYAVSGNLHGSFPIPLADHHSNNWDIMVVSHETGHNCATWHTHNYVPVIDGCGIGDCSSAWGGTIMSYCHQCSGGMTNLVLNFHPRVQETIENYLFNEIQCSLECDATLVGVCCLGETCTESTSFECDQSNGLFLGSGTSCASASCNPQVGACCTGVVGYCEELLPTDCANIGGTFVGYATLCADGYCDADALNACCFTSSCTDLTNVDCVIAGGTWAGVGTSCASGGCDPLENDFCETAAVVSSGVWYFSTIDAVTDDDPFDNKTCPSEWLGGVFYDVWFKYESCETGELLVSTCNIANFNTDIVVYEGVCGSMVQIGCNGGIDGVCSGYSSEVSVSVFEGETYLFRIGGFSAKDFGSGQLLISGQDCIPDVPCIGDVTYDGQIGIDDLLAVIDEWGSNSFQHDIDESGVVDSADLLLLVANWGVCN